MTSASGLSAEHRAEARRMVLRGCALLLHHKTDVHYTQGVKRWQGINQRLRVVKGQYPNYGDCSSTDTWILWNALTHVGASRDTVNGLNWGAGYTGTILQHGKHVEHRSSWQIGDQLVYGPGTGEHTALYIGNGYVFSHGSEPGPFKIAWDYRNDLQEVRRAI